MIINIIILIVVVCITWVVWTERKSKTGVRQRRFRPGVALDALHYVERRHDEERKRVENQAWSAKH